MRKLIKLPELSDHFEPTVQIVRAGEYNRHEKTASEALEYIKQVKPIPGKTVVLMLAMTASDYFGGNRNGDAWNEHDVMAGPCRIPAEDGLIPYHKTFETDGNVFSHHLNKDPERRIGEVLKAFYNQKMHRVELLLALLNQKAEDIIARIEKGEFPAGSMGCRVKFDQCSVCGNKAPTRAQYCDHAKWNLGQMLPNGKRVMVWNPRSKFFDISMVRKPADRIAYMMKKVAEEDVYDVISSAELGEHLDWTENKLAELGKLSLIQKVINGNAVALKDDDGLTPDSRAIESFCSQVAMPAAQTMPALSDGTIRKLIESHPSDVLATLSQMGILLTTPEFVKYFTWRLDPSIKIPERALENAVALQAKIFRLLARTPEILDEISDSGMFRFGDISEKVGAVLRPLLEKRSQYSSYLYRHAVPGFLKPLSSQGNLDVLTVRDPQTGRPFQTTRSAQRSAEDVAVERRTKHMLGGAAMLAGGAWLGLRPTSSALMRGIGGAGAGVGLVQGAQSFGRGAYGYPSLRADTGEDVPLRAPYGIWYDRPYRGTELVEKRSSGEYRSGSPDESLEKHAAIRAAMEACHYPGSRAKIAQFQNWEFKATSLDEAAQILGEVILL